MKQRRSPISLRTTHAQRSRQAVLDPSSRPKGQTRDGRSDRRIAPLPD